MKTIKTRTHFVYSLRIFVSAHFIIRRLACLQTLFGSFIAICRLACSGFSLSIKEKKLVESPGESRTQYNLADGVTALAQLKIIIKLCKSKARASSAKIIYSNSASDIVRSVKTTAYDQNCVYLKQSE